MGKTYIIQKKARVGKIPKSFAITTPPNKTSYSPGESIDLTGMVATVTYYDGSTEDVAGECTCSPSVAPASNSSEVQVIWMWENMVEFSDYYDIHSFLTYTVKIDQNNSDPLACCTYADDATMLEKGSDVWDGIFGARPCIMKDGVVVGYLNPNDFTQYTDGTSAPITDTTYDVMIEFPRKGLKISTDSNNVITISLTDNLEDSNFSYLAHKRGSTQKNAFYLGAYSATGSSSKLGSNSGASPLTNTSITNFINYAHNRGTGYEIMAFYQWTYIQALYVLKYGNLNSQSAVGMGYVGGSSAITSGQCNSKGMCYGTTSTTQPMKLFGLENLWGNVYQFISGLYSDSSRNLLTTTDNFGVNTSSSAWEYSVSSGVTSNTYGYMTKAQGTNNGGFVTKAVSGSSSTYFCDRAYLYASYFPAVGGLWDDGDFAGVFGCHVYNSATGSNASVGSRLMYL